MVKFILHELIKGVNEEILISYIEMNLTNQNKEVRQLIPQSTTLCTSYLYTSYIGYKGYFYTRRIIDVCHNDMWK